MNKARPLLVLQAVLLGLPVLLLTMAAAMPFAAVAVLTRGWMRLRYGRPKPWNEVVEFHSAVGWKPKPNLDTFCSFAGGCFHSRTDSEGWAGRASIEESDIVVFGDSFAFGYGVDSNQMFSEVVPGLKVKSIGSPGYNMVQELLWMRELAPRLRGKVVLWFVYFGNDLYDNLLPNLYQYRMPFVRKPAGSDEWGVVTSHVNPDAWPFSYEHHFRSVEKFCGAFQQGGLSDRTYSACHYLLEQGKQAVESAGGRLAVMTIPWVLQLSDAAWESRRSQHDSPAELDRWLPDKRFTAICRELCTPLLAGRDVLSVADHIPNEGHWTSQGHRRIAAAIARFYREQFEAGTRRGDAPGTLAPRASAQVNSQPLVSVGMPVYNGERYLRESLDSVLGQSHRNLEVIVCDNASTDSTAAICHEYALWDARVRYFRNPGNLGLTANFRRVLQLAAGEYFTWASADDVRPLDAIEKCVQALEDNPRAVMAHGPVVVTGSDLNCEVHFAQDADLAGNDVRRRVRNFTEGIGSNAMVYGVYRLPLLVRTVFGEVYGQDFLVVLQMCFFGPIVRIDSPIIRYRERGAVPSGNRMYAERAITLPNLLRVGAHWKRKCWTVLFTGVRYALRLEGPSRRERLRGTATFIRAFARTNGSRLRRELVFQAFAPVTYCCWQGWRLASRWPLSLRFVRKLQTRIS